MLNIFNNVLRQNGINFTAHGGSSSFGAIGNLPSEQQDFLRAVSTQSFPPLR